MLLGEIFVRYINEGSIKVSGKLLTYPSPNPTLRLTSHLIMLAKGRGRWAVSQKPKLIPMILTAVMAFPSCILMAESRRDSLSWSDLYTSRV